MKARWIVGCLLVAACASVLGFRPKGPQPFPHRKHVLAGVECTRCHRDIEHDDGTRLHIPDDASCVAACHTKPHDRNPCSNCHGGRDAVAILGEVRAHLIFDHGTHLPRVGGNCMRCHHGIAEGDTNLRPPMATCFRCHGHEQDARRCEACHKDLEVSGELPATHLAHDGDWMREHGTRAASSADLCAACHGERFCARCHGVTTAALPARQYFADPFTPSVHRANFLARHALAAKADPGACQTCHQPERCLACHVARDVAGKGRRNPHPPNWVGISQSENLHGREARRDPASCAGCHGGAGEMLCVNCHRVGGVGGSPHPAGWSSRLPMDAMPCRLCHPIGAR